MFQLLAHRKPSLSHSPIGLTPVGSSHYFMVISGNYDHHMSISLCFNSFICKTGTIKALTS